MKLVEFNNGKFGIKVSKSWFSSPKFVDLEDPSSEWSLDSRFFKCCMGTREKAVTVMRDKTFSYKIAKPPREEDFV